MKAKDVIGAWTPLIALYAFMTSPAAPSWVEAMKELALDRCPRCGYRWATGRHAPPWVGHA